MELGDAAVQVLTQVHIYESSFTGEQFCDWLVNTFTDIKTHDEATDWGKSLFEKGLIGKSRCITVCESVQMTTENVNRAHGFEGLGHFLYRLRREYDPNRSSSKKPTKSWFGGKPAQGPRDLIQKHAGLGSQAHAPLGKLGENGLGLMGTGGSAKTRKIEMSQSIVIDLDPLRKSDRAEIAVLHSDIIHNARNA